jgi:hypothetical protein
MHSCFITFVTFRLSTSAKKGQAEKSALLHDSRQEEECKHPKEKENPWGEVLGLPHLLQPHLHFPDPPHFEIQVAARFSIQIRSIFVLL